MDLPEMKSIFLMFDGSGAHRGRVAINSLMALRSQTRELGLNPKSLSVAAEAAIYKGHEVVIGFGSTAVEALHAADADGRVFLGDFNHPSSAASVLEYIEKHKPRSFLVITDHT